jgi:hypothetical protein
MELSCAALWPTRRGWYSDQRGRIPFGLEGGVPVARPREEEKAVRHKEGAKSEGIWAHWTRLVF